MSEQIIVSLTSYGKRLVNLPSVLDTIFAQTVVPHKVALNLAIGESIPTGVSHYLEEHGVEITRVPDTKVYKKLIPTLRRYPDDIIISIDDDWLYPKEMIEDFLDVHSQYPNNPVSGNRVVIDSTLCHCGCASLTKAEHFGPYLDTFDTIISSCPCDDIAYTYFANKAGHPYVCTRHEYFSNLQPYGDIDGYSEQIGYDAIRKSLDYLVGHFGDLPRFPSNYIDDPYLSSLLSHIHCTSVREECEQTRHEVSQQIRQTHAYRIGRMLIWPLSKLRSLTIQHETNRHQHHEITPPTSLNNHSMLPAGAVSARRLGVRARTDLSAMGGNHSRRRVA